MYDISMVRPPVAVNISRSKDADNTVPLPAYETDGAVGMDVRANFPMGERDKTVTLEPGERKLIPTGLIMDVPVGYEMQVRPRSGLALKSGITLANSPGTIDSDFRGEVGIILVNLSKEAFHVVHGDRVAQFVFAPVTRCEWREVDDHPATMRGTGGFGSTGV